MELKKSLLLSLSKNNQWRRTSTISEINNVFGYDYEDGYDIRVQVFHDYLNKKFDEIAEQQGSVLMKKPL